MHVKIAFQPFPIRAKQLFHPFVIHPYLSSISVLSILQPLFILD